MSYRDLNVGESYQLGDELWIPVGSSGRWEPILPRVFGMKYPEGFRARRSI